MNTIRSRCWMFTSWQEPLWQEKMVDFIIYQPEIAPKTKKLHYQGYLEFKCPKRLNEAKKAFINNPSIHLEVRRGTQQQAIDYCTKILTRAPDGQPVMHGEPKAQGERSDITSMYESLLEGCTPKEILHAYGGNALRYMGAICKAAGELWEFDDSITIKVLRKRQLADKMKGTARAYAINCCVGSHKRDEEEAEETEEDN